MRQCQKIRRIPQHKRTLVRYEREDFEGADFPDDIWDGVDKTDVSGFPGREGGVNAAE